MADNFSIDIDFKDTVKGLTLLQKSHIPFASAVALTRLAQGSQKANQNNLKKHFTLRNPTRMKSGIKIKAAKKGDFIKDTQHSLVFDLDDFMEAQEFGGTKTATNSSVSVPSEELSRTGRTSKGAIKTSLKPRKLIDKMGKPRKAKKGRRRKPKPFVMRIGGKAVAIAVRKSSSSDTLKYLYTFKKSVKIKPRFQFERTTEKYVIANYGKVFAAELKKAIG